jgi:predicted TIM-barrel fold metal-dependent hydrolase
MIINEWDISRELYFVRDLDTDRNMLIGTIDECKQFQTDYNNEKRNNKFKRLKR